MVEAETVFEALETDSLLTQLLAHEEFIVYL
jgi:hypothetical protein